MRHNPSAFDSAGVLADGSPDGEVSLTAYEALFDHLAVAVPECVGKSVLVVPARCRERSPGMAPIVAGVLWRGFRFAKSGSWTDRISRGKLKNYCARVKTVYLACSKAPFTTK